MCIAILNTIDPIAEQTLINCYENNSDGNGLLWSENGQLKTFKNFDLNEFLDKYYEIRKTVKTPIAIHFRIATSGQIDLTNCHPFIVNKNLAFIHNGIIPNLGNTHYSDTYLFNEYVLKTLQNNFLYSRQIKEKISKEIGYSKLVFLDSDARYTLINENLGHWHEDNWYSNDSYTYSSNNQFPTYDDDYFSSFYGEDLPLYYFSLDDEEKEYLFNLLDFGMIPPNDLDMFKLEYDYYC